MKKIAFIILFSIMLAGCEQVIDLNIPSTTSRLVIEGGVFSHADGQPHVQLIKLSKSVAFFDKNSQPVTNATVSVTDGTTNYVFQHTANGVYQSLPFAPAMGKTYSLTLFYQGATYTASEVMIAPVPIINMYFEYKDVANDPFADGNQKGYQTQIDFADPAGIENFYLRKILVNGEETFFADPGNRFNSITADTYFDGKLITQAKVNDEYLAQPEDEVEAQLFNISKRQYEFYNLLFTLTSGGSLLGDPPPARLIGNVENSTSPKDYPLGFFQVAGIDTRLKEVPR
ncbi:MAG: DUF4249 domain-containing protein [Cytophagales bacterium]